MRSFELRVAWLVLSCTAFTACGPGSETAGDPPDSLSDTAVGTASEALTAPSLMPLFYAPAGDLPATRHALVNGIDAAVLPNGRIVTPAGAEIGVAAPKPNGIALSPDGTTLATSNDGTQPFSATLIRDFGT